MRTKLLCAALLLTSAGTPAYVTACDCGDSGCYDCGGGSDYCGGQMESFLTAAGQDVLFDFWEYRSLGGVGFEGGDLRVHIVADLDDCGRRGQ